MREQKNLRYAVLFGGGAIRGLAYCGTVKALEEIGVDAPIVAGSSVGSIFAGLYALGCSCEEIRETLMGVNYELFKDVHFSLGTFALSKGEVFLEWVREIIEKKFYGNAYKKGENKAVTFSDIEKELVVITTDLSNFQCKEFSKSATPDFEIAKAIRISCGMPGLMKPYEYNNTMLVDGDLQKSMPMWKLTETLQPKDMRIMEIRLEGDFQGSEKNAIEYLNSVYSYATCTGTAFIKGLYGDSDKFDYPVINTGNLNIVDFNIPKSRREELMQSGYEQTMEYFTKELVVKKIRLGKIYSGILKSLKSCGQNISSGKLLKARENILDIFVCLTDTASCVDPLDIDMLKGFKQIFDGNFKQHILFGRVSLIDEKSVRKSLGEVTEKFSQKIEEFRDYIQTIGKEKLPPSDV